MNEADRCAKCGFCEAVCPTYNAARARHYGPRGRLHMAKYIFEGGRSKRAIESIATCLRCRACELVCPANIKIVEVITEARKIINDEGA